MNSDQLRQFQVIAQCGSITKAAERLYITQPALSMALNKLEEELACQLFYREGRNIRITAQGEKLLEYSEIVTRSIDEATDYFAMKEYTNYIKIYRIGGVSLPLLTEGCYNLPDYRLNTFLVLGKDLSSIIGSGVADLAISDDKYMSPAMHKYVERIPLYHQQMLLSVALDDPLAQRDTISFLELQDVPTIGRTNPTGFQAWVNDVKRLNEVDFNEEIAIDNSTYFTERNLLPLPYLMGSFGIGTIKGREYFQKRKSLVVTGKYTSRIISIWWNRQNRKEMKPLIMRILENAEAIKRLDASVKF